MYIETEAQAQKTLIRWWAVACRTYQLPESVLLHITNEGKRSVVMGRILKNMGMRPGTPDLFLAVPRNGLSGLWIEMKRSKGGNLSVAQRRMLDMLKEQGYTAHVCHGFDEARNCIRAYLKGNV